MRTTALPTFLVTVKPTRAPVGVGGLSPRHELQREGSSRLPPTARDPLKLGPPLQAAGRRAGRSGPCIRGEGLGLHPRVAGPEGTHARPARGPAAGSGRKLLAAARPAGVKNLAAADRRHARAKAMAALANELAGLIGPLHDRISNAFDAP